MFKEKVILDYFVGNFMPSKSLLMKSLHRTTLKRVTDENLRVSSVLRGGHLRFMTSYKASATISDKASGSRF